MLRNGFGRRAMIAITTGAAFAVKSRVARSDTTTVQVGYLRWMETHQTISLLDKAPPDNGLAGAKLAMNDNNTTGRFMNQQFELSDAPVREDDDPAAVMSELAERGVVLMLSDLPAERLLKLADAARAKQITLFNIQAPDDALRQENCRDNVIHVAPSRAMLADALAQYLVWKKWSRWVLMFGSHPEDALLADAYRRAALRFGAHIVKEREYKDSGGSRQTDSGVVQTQQQMPVFTQGLPDYDVLVTADENEVFADYLPYRTWDARPVVGSAGLRPVTWDPASESLGRDSTPGPLRPHGASPHDRARHAGLDRMSHDRRGRQSNQFGRSGEDHAGHEKPDLWRCGLQGPETLVARLGLAASPADPAVGRSHRRVHLAATGLPAPGN